MPDILYPVKKKGPHEELRFSLRSLKNIDHGMVCIVGHTPKWAKNVISIETDQPYKKYENLHNNLYAAVNNPQLSEDIIVMNDDFFILKPLDKMGVYHSRELNFSRWKAMSASTLLLMKKLGSWSGYSYELHVPFLCKKSKLKFILEAILEEGNHNVFWRSIYGNHFRIGGEMMLDCKVRENPSIPDSYIFASSEETTFDKHLKQWLEPRFSAKSIYEK